MTNETDYTKLFTPDAVDYVTLTKQIRALEAKRKPAKERLMRAFEETGVKTFTHDDFQLTYTKPGQYKALDVTTVKKTHPEIYDECSVMRVCSARLTMTDFTDLETTGYGNSEE